jgi:hypothetical protein
MGLENMSGRMVEYMKVNTNLIRNMVMELIDGQMARNMKVIG